MELQATHGNITDKAAYKKALYAREAEGSTYVDNGITVPHAKTDVVTRPSLAALRLAKPVQYNAEDDGTTDLLFAIAAPENGSLHVDMLARMMQMLMNEDFVAKLKAAKTPAEFLDCIDAQEDAQFGTESFTQQEIRQNGYRILAVTACVNGIAHTYMAAEALTKAGDKLGLPTKVETNGSDGAKNILTKEEIAACDGIIVAAEKKVETARFDGKPVLFTRVDDGIHKPEELIKKIVHGEVPVYHAEGGAQATDDASGNYEVMAAVMVGGMVPPIAIALSTTFCPKKWTPDERRNGIVNYVMGLCFVTEGAIPYAAADPLRILPSCVAGAAVAGALSMTFGCALRAPHGGIFVFPVVDHAVLYCVALAVGSVLGAVILSLLKKNRTDAE